MIFNKKHILLNANFETKEDLFSFISEESVKEKISDSTQTLVDGFVKRENEGTTGFEDGFAIPHARIEGVKIPSIYVTRNSKKYSNWESLDGNGVQYTIALLIPSTSGDLHMSILSSIAVKLMEEQFRETIKSGTVDEIYNQFNSILKGVMGDEEVISEQSNNSKGLIVGISACPAGIAHTFMSKKKMIDSAQSMGYEIKWETQGAGNQKTPLTKDDIESADLVIIASDIDIDLSRFIGKKLLLTDTNDSIKNGTKLIERAFEEAKVMTETSVTSNESKLKAIYRRSKIGFLSAFNVPWAYLGITASLLAVISLIGFSTYGSDWANNAQTLNVNLFKLQEIAKIALTFSMPFMAYTIVKNSTKNTELSIIVFLSIVICSAPYVLTNWHSVTNYQQTNTYLIYDWNGKFNLSSQHGSNVLAAIVLTICALIINKPLLAAKNYAKNLKNKTLIKFWSPWLSPLLFSILIFGIAFLTAAPLGFASGKVTYALIDYANDYWWLRIIIGGVLGALIVSDMGGTLNKLTLITLIGMSQYDLRMASINSIAIPLASLGFGFTWKIFQKRFDKEDFNEGKVSFRKGLNGMTEGPLNLYNKYKWRVFLPNIIATFVASGLGYAIGIYIFKGGIEIWMIGAQAHLAQPNDIEFLRKLLPMDKHEILWLCSILYGIVGYLVCMTAGILTYASVSWITFSLPGKNKIFKKR